MDVVIYARYSSHNQTEQSIEGQLNVCYDYAKQNNLNVLDEYIDRAYTGTNDSRPNFQRMLEDAKTRTFQGILVYQLDRFSRNKYDSVIAKYELKKYGVKVISAKEHITDNSAGILMEALFEGINEYYSAELSEKIRRGYDNSASKLQFLGGNCGLGYKINKETRKLEIDEATAPFVKKIFEMYAGGNTIAEICNYLNERNIKTSIGGKFNKNSLRNMLTNKKYIGIYTYKDKETPNAIPRIISDELFMQVGQIANKNKRISRNTRAKEEYILTSKLFCGHCKEQMIGVSGTSKQGSLHRYYKCVKARKKMCDKKSIRKQLLEDIVVNACRDILTPKNIDKIARTVVAMCKKDLDSLIVKDLKKNLKTLNKEKENLLKTLKSGTNQKVKDIIFDELEKLANQKDEIELQIKREELQHVRVEVPQVKFFLNDLKNGDINDVKYRRALITVLINKIYLYDDKVTIIFNTQNRPVEITDDLLKDIEGSPEDNSAPDNKKGLPCVVLFVTANFIYHSHLLNNS